MSTTQTYNTVAQRPTFTGDFVKVFAATPKFKWDDTTDRNILLKHWLVARNASPRGQTPAVVLIRSRIHGTTSLLAQRGGHRQAPRPCPDHITTSFATESMLQGEEGDRTFYTAHGYTGTTADTGAVIIETIGRMEVASKCAEVASSYNVTTGFLWPQSDDDYPMRQYRTDELDYDLSAMQKMWRAVKVELV